VVHHLAAFVLCAGLLPASVGAQARPRRAVSEGRIVNATPPAPIVVFPQVPQLGFNGAQPIVNGLALTGSVPVVVLPDGRVFANFGFGFEPVTQACTTSQPVPLQFVTPSQPVVNQPAPALPTATENIPTGQPGGSLQVITTQQTACFTTLGATVFVFRR
jgi:hypothetical protein